MSNIKYATYLFLIYSLNFTHISSAGEYAFTSVRPGSFTKENYYDQKGLPDVYVGKKCKSLKLKCVPALLNQDKKVLHTYPKDHSIGIVLKTRYADSVYAVVNHSYTVKKKTITEIFLIDGNGKKSSIDSLSTNMANILAKNRDIISIKGDGLFINNALKLKAPKHIETAVLSNNPQGDISALVIANDNQLYWSDLDQWYSTGVFVSERSDRLGVLAYYPMSNNRGFAAYYSYFNSYNKGLRLLEWNNGEAVKFDGWLFNSEERNIGFDPDIYVEANDIVVSAKDTTNRNKVHFVVELDKLNTIGDVTPQHTIDFDENKKISLLGGTSLSYLDWLSSSQERSENPLVKVKYDIASSFYIGTYFQGRISDTQIAVSYIKNEAEKKGGLKKRASQLLSATIDINELFSKRSTMRLAMNRSDVNGIAQTDDLGGIFSEFTSKFYKYQSMLMFERGLFVGIQYLEYQMPSAIGFSDNTKEILYTDYDPSLNSNQFGILIGYDELHYAHRYENNFRRIYYDFSVGFGFGKVDLSDSLVQEVESLGYKINSTLTINMLGNANLGYIYQRKFRSMRGAGFSVVAGYKLNFQLMGASQSQDNESTLKENEVTIEFSKVDFWHGPFMALSLVF